MKEANEVLKEEAIAARPNLLGLRARTKVLLAVAALLFAVLASGVTQSDKGSVEVGLPAAANPSMPNLSTVPLPSSNAKVYHQAMPFYHWREDCPLAGAKSLRGDKHELVQRKYMTRQEAEKHKFTPCVYCADFED